MSTEIDVVIPSAGWDHIFATLDSIDAQQEVTPRVIVVNDSGEPAPAEVHDRARVFDTTGFIGEGAARAFGLEQVTTKLVAFCDNDDTWAPDKLLRQVGALGDQQGWCMTGAQRVDGDGVYIEDWPLTTVAKLLEDGELERRVLSHNPFPAGPSSILVDTELLRSVGGWNRELDYFADWDCFIRLIKVVPPTLIDAPLVSYRVWPGQMVGDRRRGWRALDAIRESNSDRRKALGVGPLDDRVIAWILQGELSRPDRRVPGIVAAAQRLRPRSVADLRALPMYASEFAERSRR